MAHWRKLRGGVKQRALCEWVWREVALVELLSKVV
jgi:hypothetical protein